MIEIAMQLERIGPVTASFAPPYSIRSYRAGDATTWLYLQQSTGIYRRLDPDLFHREFGHNPVDRQFFVMRGAETVATGTAWHGEPLREKRWGRLHWIAVHPLHQRRGLGLQLCVHLLAVLHELGCTGAFLTTGSENRPAIALYRRLGFQPWARTPEEATFWAAVER